jgi:hydrogenase maturation protein HypF
MLALEDTSLALNPYPYAISRENGIKVIKLGKLISAIMKDVMAEVPAAQVAARFHVTIADVIVQTCLQLSLETCLRQVALSGGVFQNRLLFRLVTTALEKAKLTVLTHHLVPCNDGGLALGQAVIADRNLP